MENREINIPHWASDNEENDIIRSRLDSYWENYHHWLFLYEDVSKKYSLPFDELMFLLEQGDPREIIDNPEEDLASYKKYIFNLLDRLKITYIDPLPYNGKWSYGIESGAPKYPDMRNLLVHYLWTLSVSRKWCEQIHCEYKRYKARKLMKEDSTLAWFYDALTQDEDLHLIYKVSTNIYVRLQDYWYFSWLIKSI